MADLTSFLRHLARATAGEALADRSDRQLVEQALARPDEAVFATIVRRHGGMVYRVCRRVLRHDQDAEDAFQATFLVLARKLATVRRHQSLASWLHGVAHRAALQARDRGSARRRREHRAAAPEATPPDDATWREVREALDGELARLPDKWRLPLVLCYLEGRTQDEAARQLGVSKNTLRARLGEAQAALGRRLARRGVTWSAAGAAVLVSDCVARAGPPPGLVSSTVEATARTAAGLPMGAAASAGAAGLSEGVVQTMVVTKLHVVLAGSVVVGLLAIAVGSAPRGQTDVAPADPPVAAEDSAVADQTIRNEPPNPKKNVDKVSPAKVEPPRADPPLPGVGGKVTSVGAGSTPLAQIDIGSDSGLSAGHTLIVYRGKEYLGDLKLTEVQPKIAVGQFTAARKGSQIKRDDRVITSFSGPR